MRQSKAALEKPEQEYVRVQKAARMIDISVPSIWRMLTEKKIKRYKVGGRTVVSVAEIRNLPKLAE